MSKNIKFESNLQNAVNPFMKKLANKISIVELNGRKNKILINSFVNVIFFREIM